MKNVKRQRLSAEPRMWLGEKHQVRAARSFLLGSLEEED